MDDAPRVRRLQWILTDVDLQAPELLWTPMDDARPAQEPPLPLLRIPMPMPLAPQALHHLSGPRLHMRPSPSSNSRMWTMATMTTNTTRSHRLRQSPPTSPKQPTAPSLWPSPPTLIPLLLPQLRDSSASRPPARASTRQPTPPMLPTGASPPRSLHPHHHPSSPTPHLNTHTSTAARPTNTEPQLHLPSRAATDPRVCCKAAASLRRVHSRISKPGRCTNLISISFRL